MKGYPEETLYSIYFETCSVIESMVGLLNLLPDNTAIVEGFECGASF